MKKFFVNLSQDVNNFFNMLEQIHMVSNYQQDQICEY